MSFPQTYSSSNWSGSLHDYDVNRDLHRHGSQCRIVCESSEHQPHHRHRDRSRSRSRSPRRYMDQIPYFDRSVNIDGHLDRSRSPNRYSDRTPYSDRSVTIDRQSFMPSNTRNIEHFDQINQHTTPIRSNISSNTIQQYNRDDIRSNIVNRHDNRVDRREDVRDNIWDRHDNRVDRRDHRRWSRSRSRSRSPRRSTELNRVSDRLLGLDLSQAQLIYPNIRVVVRDGYRLLVTEDFRPLRINVETRNGIIIRIDGYY